LTPVLGKHTDPDEQVSLAFAEVCWEYRDQDATGGVGNTRRFCFDVAGNRSAELARSPRPADAQPDSW
jgi:hypothetical protein